MKKSVSPLGEFPQLCPSSPNMMVVPRQATCELQLSLHLLIILIADIYLTSSGSEEEKNHSIDFSIYFFYHFKTPF